MRQVIWAGALLGVVAAGAVLHEIAAPDFAHSQQAAAPRPQAGVPVRITTAVTKPTPVEFNTIGTVQTIASVSVKSRVDAVIDQVLVKDGQFVKAGDVLFQLDSRASQAALHQAEASLARDQVQLANAQRNANRSKSLIAKNFVSQQQFDTDSSTAAALEATVKADQAQVENAKVLLSYYTIVAPIEGRVGLISIKQGNSIKANDVPLASVNQIQPIYVSVALPQNNLPELRAAMAKGPVTVRVTPAGDKGEPISGKIAFFDNTIDSTSGTINVRSAFDNTDQRLWPGQFVNVSVVVRTDPNALVIAPAAIQAGQNGTYVFVIKDDNTAEARPVTVDRTVGGMVVISKGLSPGEKVVTDGQLRLSNGTRVQIVTDAPKGDAS
ncbi:MAG TPA: efflux RND transporter periplasmic adaptor subunit [Stellaceae bacterium]|nr:efflux RND transporter periplasmic adaptor subunit [Stellaceae bacterium]